MSRRRSSRDQANLFEDFDLHPELADAPVTGGAADDSNAEAEQMEFPPSPDPEPEDAAHVGPPREPGPASVRARLFSGLVDLAVHVGMLAVVLVAVRVIGIVPDRADVPAFGLWCVVFSLFYSVIPLAFWGRTPGMMAAGLQASALDGGPMTFSDAARRWLGGAVTAALAGLPVLMAARGGRSLADRVSRSITIERPGG